MRFGLIVPQGWREDLEGRDFETMAAVARRAEKLGFDSVWLYDHLQTRAGDPDRVLECWTSLAALARETSTVQLGQIVTAALYRNPGLLAQMASTVDAASGGRVVVGVGAGWDEREWRDFDYGDDYPPVRDRLRRLERTLQVLRERRPGRPILVGGAGEKVLLRLVARYADACNLTDSFDPAYYRHKLGVLRAHCEDVGRDYAEIEKTASFTVTTDDRVDFDALAAAGIERFIVYLDPPTDLGLLARFAGTVVSTLQL
jgi:alkanesulfonate monooxygenase SsuD/methylene tetrahydromethanopterin reductase-like flavin-dependent oxidoreductase (luciferase family)